MLALNRRKKIRVLVCAANLGNACPDERSMEAWLPHDGNYQDVVHNPQYPLPSPADMEELRDELGLKGMDNDVVYTGPIPPYQPSINEQNGQFDDSFGSLTSSDDDDDDDDDNDDDDSSQKKKKKTNYTYRSVDRKNDGNSKTQFDIIVVGLQEATFDVEDTDETSLVHLTKTVLKPLEHGKTMVQGLSKDKDYTKKTTWSGGDSKDSVVLQRLLQRRCPSYNFAVRYQRGEMRLEILTHPSLQVEVLRVRAQNTGIGMNGVMNAANKGGIVAELRVENSTNLAFCTAHLQAHEGQDNYKNRCRMTQAILDGTGDDHYTPGVKLDPTVRSHVTFFLGDLNFRTDLYHPQNKGNAYNASDNSTIRSTTSNGSAMRNNSIIINNNSNHGKGHRIPAFIGGGGKDASVNSSFLSTDSNRSTILDGGIHTLRTATSDTLRSVFNQVGGKQIVGGGNNNNGADAAVDKEMHMQQIRQMVRDEDWLGLHRADELIRALQQKDCLFGFQTLPCYFPPTFKVLRQDGFFYKDNRRPSYTDRILWTTTHKCEDAVQPRTYEPIRDFVTSDHKPIRGAFDITLNDVIYPKLPKTPSRMTLSTRNLISRSTRRSGGQGDQTLHLFFSNMKAGIRKRHVVPDPYISFITFPKELIQSQETRWEKFRGRLRKGANLSQEAVANPNQATAKGKVRTVHGFPRTRRLRATYHPFWRDDEVKITIKPHDKTGKPLDMTGSLLLLTLLDHSTSPIDGSLIGVFALNLAHLCMSTTDNNNSNRVLMSSQSADEPMSNGSSSSHGGGLGKLFGRGSSNRSLDGDSKGRQHPPEVRTLHLKQPLSRSGKHRGWIACTVDAWWLDDATPADSRKSIATHAAKLRRGGSFGSSTRSTPTQHLQHMVAPDTSLSPMTLPSNLSGVSSTVLEEEGEEATWSGPMPPNRMSSPVPMTGQHYQSGTNPGRTSPHRSTKGAFSTHAPPGRGTVHNNNNNQEQQPPSHSSAAYQPQPAAAAKPPHRFPSPKRPSDGAPSLRSHSPRRHSAPGTPRTHSPHRASAGQQPMAHPPNHNSSSMTSGGSHHHRPQRTAMGKLRHSYDSSSQRQHHPFPLNVHQGQMAASAAAPRSASLPPNNNNNNNNQMMMMMQPPGTPMNHDKPRVGGGTTTPEPSTPHTPYRYEYR